ncbi:tetratricopeptide repeat protein [Streptomyces sp. NPDC054956]
MGVTVPPRTPPDLSGDGFATVLAVHMAALTEVDALSRGEDPPRGPDEISRYLLLREQTYWERLFAVGRVATPPGTFARAVYAATLTGALPWSRAREVITHLDISPGDPGQALDDHAVAYPARQPDTVLEPLYPDRLAEDFIALMLPHGSPRSLLSTAWTTRAPERLFSLSSSSLESRLRPRRALITLIETAQRWEHVAERQLVPLLTAQPALVQRGGSAALSGLLRIPFLEPGLLDLIESRLPFRDPELDAGAAEIARHVTPYRLSRAGGNAMAQAEIHGHLAHRLRNIEDHGAAAAQAVRALGLITSLAPRTEEHRERLAFYLDCAGVYYDLQGNDVPALGCSQRAVSLYQGLVERHQDQPEAHGAFQRRLTYALANLAGRDLLPATERLEVAREAVTICRGLVHGSTVPDDVELAGALHNLGRSLYQLGRYEESLAPVREAAAIRRAQAAGNFALYAEHLELLLGVLTHHLVMVDRREEARSTAWEHVAVLRRLADADPGRFSGPLAEAQDAAAELEGPG